MAYISGIGSQEIPREKRERGKRRALGTPGPRSLAMGEGPAKDSKGEWPVGGRKIRRVSPNDPGEERDQQGESN